MSSVDRNIQTVDIQFNHSNDLAAKPIAPKRGFQIWTQQNCPKKWRERPTDEYDVRSHSVNTDALE